MGKCVSKGSLTHASRVNQGHFSSCDESEWERIISIYRENNNLTRETENAEVTEFNLKRKIIYTSLAKNFLCHIDFHPNSTKMVFMRRVILIVLLLHKDFTCIITGKFNWVAVVKMGGRTCNSYIGGSPLSTTLSFNRENLKEIFVVIFVCLLKNLTFRCK